MTAWEIDIDVTVRRTITFAGPQTEDAAREIAQQIATGQLGIESFWKWTTARNGYVVPAERVLGPGLIAAIRQTEA